MVPGWTVLAGKPKVKPGKASEAVLAKSMAGIRHPVSCVNIDVGKGVRGALCPLKLADVLANNVVKL